MAEEFDYEAEDEFIRQLRSAAALWGYDADRQSAACNNARLSYLGKYAGG